MASTVSRTLARGCVTAALALAVTATSLGCTADDRRLDDDAAVSGPDPGRRGDDPLLRESDLGRGYRDDPAPGEDEDLTRAGCLSAVTALGTRAARQMTVQFTTDDPFDSSVVTHTVLEFDDREGAGDALADWRDAVTDCDVVEYEQQDSTLRLDVATDTERHGSAVADEVNLIATGEVDSDPLDIDVSQWVSVARIGEHLSVVQVLDLHDEDAVDEGRRLARLTAERLDRWAS